MSTNYTNLHEKGKAKAGFTHRALGTQRKHVHHEEIEEKTKEKTFFTTKGTKFHEKGKVKAGVTQRALGTQRIHVHHK